MEKLVFAFSCAGGSADSFRKLAKYIDCRFIPMEYDGHWTRCDESLQNSFHDFLDGLFNRIVKTAEIEDELYLVGHSMGGMVAYEIAKRLTKAGYNTKSVFLFACFCPEDLDVKLISFSCDEDVKDFLKSIRQVPENILKSDFFSEYLLPAIKNDFLLIIDYLENCNHKSVISCPIICMAGDEDNLVNNMERWKEHTCGDFFIHEFEGDHFFLFRKENLSLICEQLNSYLSK